MEIIISCLVGAMAAAIMSLLIILQKKRSLERQLYEAHKQNFRIQDQYGAMEADELLEILAVPEDEPWLRAVYHIFHKNSLIQAEMAGSYEMDAPRSKGHAMAAVAIEDSCDELLRTTERALQARAGHKIDLSEA